MNSPAAYSTAVTQTVNLPQSAPIVWASDVSGDWDNPSMWVGGSVPGSTDNAVIPFGDITVTHSTAASDSVHSITSRAPIVLDAGSLTIDSASTINSALTVSFNSLTNSGATLGVNGALAVSGLFTLAPARRSRAAVP